MSYGDDLFAKSGRSNGIHVKGILKETRQIFFPDWRRRKGQHAVENVFVCVRKLLQAIAVRTENASGLLTGQTTIKSAGVFTGTAI